MLNNKDFKKILLVSLVLITLLMIVLIIRAWNKNRLDQMLSKKSSQFEEQLIEVSPTVEILSGLYSLVFSESTVKVEEASKATISFSTPGKIISGADVILHFDPKLVQVEGDVIPGEFFTSYPRTTVDNEKGTIKVTAFSPSSTIEVNDLTELFSVNFKAVNQGVASVTFDFQPGKTNLSTLVEKGTSKNILGQVINGEIGIKN